jgi:beta-galactosidase
LNERAPFGSLRANAIEFDRPVPMEDLGQSYGFISYATTVTRGGDGTLECDGVHDFATVLVDGRIHGYLDRRRNAGSLTLEGIADGALLEILAENCGRVNYGFFLSEECKGILGPVRWKGLELRKWRIASIPLDDLSQLRFQDQPAEVPAFYRGTFVLDRTGDTFFDTSALGKGVLWLNGHNLGRYWDIGPQASLYVPAPWLRRGTNEAIVFDVFPVANPRIKGANGPVYRATQ